jgi:hypothetical protein
MQTVAMATNWSADRSDVQWSPAMRQAQIATDRNALVLAGLRVAVGVLFVIFGQYKVFGTQFTLHGGFEWWVNRFLQDGDAYPFFVPVLQKIVLPHAMSIAFLIAYGELLSDWPSYSAYVSGLSAFLGSATCFYCCSRPISPVITFNSGSTLEPRSIIPFSLSASSL